MKILVFLSRLDVGGTQVNAIELAAGLRDLYGHDIVLFATPGPMLKLVEEKQLRFLAAPDASSHPSIARMRALDFAVTHERPDLVHVWDWPQCLDAFYCVYLLRRIPMLVTAMSMGVDRILPRAVPTTFGTPELIEKARVTGRHKLELILPPVDLQQNSLDAVDARPFREQYGLQPADIVLVTVSRLVDWMKAESLRRTIDAVRVVARECQVRLLIVGDGPMRPELEDLANKTNTEIGASVVVLTGALLDPRPAYAAANIVIGMGGSALRGMAFSKPVIIVGENGFSAPLTPNTAESFYHKGMYGVGDADPENADLIGHIRQLAQDPEKLRMLGRFSRNFVERSFSLEAAIARLEKFCRTAANEAPRLHVAATEGVRIATIRLADRLLPNRLISSLRIRIGHG